MYNKLCFGLISLVRNTISKSSLRRKAYFSSLHFTVHHQGKPRQEFQARTVKEQCLLVCSRAHNQLLYCLSSSWPPPINCYCVCVCVHIIFNVTCMYGFRAIWPCTACLIQAKLAQERMALAYSGLVLLHQEAIKKYCCRPPPHTHTLYLAELIGNFSFEVSSPRGC